MGNAIICLDFNIKNLGTCSYLARNLSESGLNYYNHHPYGFGCYEPVYMHYYGFDTLEHLQSAEELIKANGFTPLVCIDGRDDRCKANFDPYEIILDQPSTKRYSKEILKEIAWHEGYRDAQRRFYEEIRNLGNKPVRKYKKRRTE